MPLDIRVGQVVLLNNGAQAVVRYVGETSFKPGLWVGVELPTPVGKNNGVVAGVRYFDAPDNCGLFLGPSGVKRVLREPSAGSSSGAGSRTPMEDQKRPDVSTSRRVSSMRNAETAPASARPGSRTRTGSLARQPDVSSGRGSRNSGASVSSGSNGTGTGTGTGTGGGNSTPAAAAGTNPFNPDGRLQPDTTARRAKGAGMASDRRTSFRPGPPPPPPPSGTRQSLGMRLASGGRSPVKRGPSAMSVTSGVAPSGLFSVAPSATPSGYNSALNSEVSTPIEANNTGPKGATAVDALVTLSDSALNRNSGAGLSQAAPAGPPSGPSSSSAQVQELQAKLRLMERRRVEDRERIAAGDAAREENERYRTALSRMQAKSVKQQAAIAAKEKQIAELEAAAAAAAARTELDPDFETQLEMATLDREVAEEQAELYRAELAETKLRLEELQLELDIAEGNRRELEGDMSADEKRTRGWVQMERENERLREALLRLRDLSRAEAAEFQDRVKALEAEVTEHEATKAAVQDAQGRAERAEAVAGELRQQLDAAEEAAEMVEQLSARNLALAEEVGRLQAAVRDLETLRELSEEVEQCQAANERQLLEMLDERDGAAAELARKVVDRDELLADQAFAIDRLRAMVDRVQAEAEAERARREERDAGAREREVAELAELTTRLHRTSAGALGRQVEAEIVRLAGREGGLVWRMVAPLVPAELAEMVAAAEGVMVAWRAGGKAGAVAQGLKEGLVTAGDGGGGSGARPGRVSLAIGVAVERMPEVARLVGQLTEVSGLCARMVAFVDRLSPDRAAGVGKRLAELGPVEKTVEKVAAMVRGDMDVGLAVEEVGRSVAVARHVAEFMSERGDGGDDGEEREDDHPLALDCATRVLTELDLAVAIVRMCAPAEGFPAESVLSALGPARAAAAQAHRSITDLHVRGLAPPAALCAALSSAAGTAQSKLGDPVRRVATAALALLHDPARTGPASAAEVVAAIGPVEPVVAAAGAISGALGPVLPVDFSTAVEIPARRAPPPWDRCGARLEASAAAARATAEQLRAAGAELADARARMRAVAAELDDAAHERDVLAARVAGAKSRVARAAELEREVDEWKAKEAAAREAVGRMEKEVAAALGRDRDAFPARVGVDGVGSGAAGGGGGGGGAVGGGAGHSGRRDGGGGGLRGVGSESDPGVWALRVRGLESAIRYLRRVLEDRGTAPPCCCSHPSSPPLPPSSLLHPPSSSSPYSCPVCPPGIGLGIGIGVGPGEVGWLARDGGAAARAREAEREARRRRALARAVVAKVAAVPERGAYVRLRRAGRGRRSGGGGDELEVKDEKGVKGEKGEDDETVKRVGEKDEEVQGEREDGPRRRKRNERLAWEPARVTPHYQLFEQQLLALDVWSVREGLGLGRGAGAGAGLGLGLGRGAGAGARPGGDRNSDSVPRKEPPARYRVLPVVRDEDRVGGGDLGHDGHPDRDLDRDRRSRGSGASALEGDGFVVV